MYIDYTDTLNGFDRRIDPRRLSDKEWEFFKAVRAAIEKQIPKKPIKGTTATWCGKIAVYHTEWHCREFGHITKQGEARPKHCPGCGQAMDWSDVPGPN